MLISADDRGFVSSSRPAALKLHVYPSPSHERASSRPKGPRHRPAPSGDHGNRRWFEPESGFAASRVGPPCLSVSGKRQLCTQRRVLTTKSRRPVRSSAPERWGEDSRARRAAWFGSFSLSLDYSAPAFSSFVRFKISKVIVVGDLAVGKTCLINR